jgi:hypothetical protein
MQAYTQKYISYIKILGRTAIIIRGPLTGLQYCHFSVAKNTQAPPRRRHSV